MFSNCLLGFSVKVPGDASTSCGQRRRGFCSQLDVLLVGGAPAWRPGETTWASGQRGQKGPLSLGAAPFPLELALQQRPLEG